MKARLIAILAPVLSAGAMAALGLSVVVDFSFRETATALSCDQVPGTAQASEGDIVLRYDAEPHPPYRTVPPTSGAHSLRVLATGVYREPLPEEAQVQVLAHGHVLVQYAPGSDVPALERIARGHPRKVVIAPYPVLGQGIALTGWQRMQLLDEADPVAIEAFIAAVAGRYRHGWQSGATDCTSIAA